MASDPFYVQVKLEGIGISETASDFVLKIDPRWSHHLYERMNEK